MKKLWNTRPLKDNEYGEEILIVDHLGCATLGIMKKKPDGVYIKTLCGDTFDSKFEFQKGDKWCLVKTLAGVDTYEEAKK